MICKACGTECRGSYCPRCGEPLIHEAYTSSAPTGTMQQIPVIPAPEPTEALPPSSPATVSALVPAGEHALATVSKTEKKKSKKTRKPREWVQIKMRQVFFPSLVYFLPLIYLFTDAFVLYSDVLRVNIDGASVLSLLITRLSDAAFVSNPVSDVIAATVGSNAPLVETLTVKGILGAPDAYQALIAPAVILAVSAVISALCGVLILFSAGKLLRRRAVADLAVSGGFFAAVAPLLASLAFRLFHMANGGFAAADAAACGFGLSIEVILTYGLSLAMMIPAVRAIRRAAGGEGLYLTAPYRLLGRKFGVIRLFGVPAALAAILLPLVTVVVEVSDSGTLLEVCFDALESAEMYADTIKAIFSEGYAFSLVAALFGLFTLPILPMMLFWSLWALFALLRLLFAKPAKVAAKRRQRKALKRTGKILRRAPITLLAFYVAFGVVAVLLLLFATGLKSHVDLTAVTETLTLLYLLLAFVKAYGTLYTAGLLLASLSLLFGTVAGGFARSFVALSRKTYQE